MSELRDALEEYLALRRSLGTQLEKSGSQLLDFADFAQSQGAEYVTTDLALRWAKHNPNAQPATCARRLGMVRIFAKWCSAIDPRTEVPPEGILPHRFRRKPPYIYSDEEIEKIIRAAQMLPSPKGLRAKTYSTIFSLLAVTGMRVSEVVALEREDVDLQEGILIIRKTKFGKSRFVPIHQTTKKALEDYAGKRDRVLPQLTSSGFFISECGTRIGTGNVRYNFAKTSQNIGLRTPAKGHGHGPRLHDMRHRFAVRTLIDWYRSGLNVEREISKLSTYLGHVHVNDTYWYLEAIPELLQLATDRMVDYRKEDGV